MFLRTSTMIIGLGTWALCAQAGDASIWGAGTSRNQVSSEAVSLDFHPGDFDMLTGRLDPSTRRGIRWTARLGSQTFGNPVVANGLVYVGTNNESPRDPKYTGDRSALYALDVATGSLQWQLNLAKLGAGKVSDWAYLGICSPATVADNRVFVVTNRCEVAALDVGGLEDGNAGPFENEERNAAWPRSGTIPMGPRDADIVWQYEMREELGIFPHNITASSILVVDDLLFANTSNGADWSHTHLPQPNAPALIAIDRETGQLVGVENSGISSRTLHGNWSSPAYGEVNGQAMVIFGGGDGWCYAFDPVPTAVDSGVPVLRELWRFDANPPEYRLDPDGKPWRYGRRNGPSEIIATPVIEGGRVYVSIGQDPSHGTGRGALSCYDASGRGDISESGLLWRYTDLKRSISTVSVIDSLCFVADYQGRLHCLDRETGTPYWVYDCESQIWGSTYVVDGAVLLGDDDGVLHILDALPRKRLRARVEFDAPIYMTPVAADGALYVATQTDLYAIGSALSEGSEAPSGAADRGEALAAP